MKRIHAPFLELAYFVGDAALEASLRKLVPEIQPGIVPKKIRVPNAVGLVGGREEIEVRNGTILLRTEGEAFSGSARKNAMRMREHGQRAYTRFLAVAESINPVYGAILVEYLLETPTELANDAKSFAFRNFFVNLDDINGGAIECLLQLAGKEAYVERIAGGVYVSMTPEFNPNGQGLPPVEAQERSVKIASVLAKALK
jgi:hypothetical protein